MADVKEDTGGGEEKRATTISPHNRVTAAEEVGRRSVLGGRRSRGERPGVFATVKADRSAGHSNTEFPVWHFTKPFEQDGA